MVDKQGGQENLLCRHAMQEEVEDSGAADDGSDLLPPEEHHSLVVDVFCLGGRDDLGPLGHPERVVSVAVGSGSQSPTIHAGVGQREGGGDPEGVGDYPGDCPNDEGIRANDVEMVGDFHPLVRAEEEFHAAGCFKRHCPAPIPGGVAYAVGLLPGSAAVI